MKQRFFGRINLILVLCSGVLGCASQAHIPAPVPPPLTGRTIAMPLPTVWSASIGALQKLGFSNVAADVTQSVLVTEDKRLKGNTAHNRNFGIARFAVERDIYSEGQSRLHITLLARKEPGQTGIRIAAELKGKVEKRGDIKYAPFKPPTEAPDSDDENQAIGVWETLSSNGVLEDRFLAALMDLLRSDNAARQSGGLLPDQFDTLNRATAPEND
ncbi:MAG: hypothetical protein M8364_02315 [Methylobacter sp.]|uniref:hypothetical protein n=1 Tax=Methylobacter sp. TaxID=2051955 RepID=UPI00258A1EB9|nr:hypothetical protein [Methylobacter sp.]MCL7419725.1 hypothetical protein [Methylobacter sp.]